MKVGLDTSVLVDLLAEDTAHHKATRACYEALRREGSEWVIPQQALLEAFSVLTRAPRPIGRPPKQVYETMRGHFRQALIPVVAANFGWEVIDHTIAAGFWGGRVHDAEIALAVHQAGAELLLTWNVRHFQTMAPVGLRIRTPETLVT